MGLVRIHLEYAIGRMAIDFVFVAETERASESLVVATAVDRFIHRLLRVASPFVLQLGVGLYPPAYRHVVSRKADSKDEERVASSLSHLLGRYSPLCCWACGLLEQPTSSSGRPRALWQNLSTRWQPIDSNGLKSSSRSRSRFS